MRAVLVALLCLPLSAAEPDWVVVKKRSPRRTGLHPILIDIEEHLPSNHHFRDEDKITWAHEGTHGVTSLIPIKSGEIGLYCLEGRGVILKHPSFTIRDIAERVPKERRGPIYQLYMVDQRKYWNDEPLYLMNEWLAYTHGSIIRKSLGIKPRHETVRYMAEMYSYVTVLLEMTEDEDIHEFAQWNLRRCMEVAGDEWPDLPAVKLLSEKWKKAR